MSEPTFEACLMAAAEAVERRLTTLFDAVTEPPVPARLTAAMRHAVLGGGKRFRPFLVLESARLIGGPRAEAAALDAAAALECVHCYSLVHDDLPAMDNDALRRGRPTVWRAYDDWTAILAGDALLTLAFEIIAGSAAIGDPMARIELVRLLAADAGQAGMVGGQIIDLEADKRGEPRLPTVTHIERLQAMKTGALVRFACEAGAIVSGATSAQRRALADYGRHLGLAFQISDDLLDARGDAGSVGKTVGKDAAAGKATLVSLLGFAEAEARLHSSVAAAQSCLSDFGPAAAHLTAAAKFMCDRRH